KEASRYQKTQAMGIALAVAEDKKQAHERERDRKKQELENLIAERDDIEADLRHQEIYAVAVDRLDAARKGLEAAREAKAARAGQLKVVMADAWRSLLSEPVRAARAAARDTASSALTSLVVSMRVDAIEKCHCGTCDQDVPDEVRARLTASMP